MLLLLLLEIALYCASLYLRIPKKFSCYFCVSFHRRGRWGRCWPEIWSTPSQRGYQERRPPIITFTPEGWGADLYRGHKHRASFCRCFRASETLAWPSRAAADLFSAHTVCSTGLLLCLPGAAAVQPPFLLFGHLYQHNWREHCVDCEFLSKII